MLELHEMTAARLRHLLDTGQISAVELTKAILERIDAVEDSVQAYITVRREEALKEAARADEMIRRGESQPLTGIPVAVKDNICVRGTRTTCGSRILADFVPPYDATVIGKLNEQGAVIIGKANMDEFAMGSSTETSAFKVTRNPWDLSRVPGGSSGGSGAAVAADEAVIALGSDTGGSVRLPASYCGVVGMKPTYGLISRYGLVAFASSLDQIGILSKTVADCADTLTAIAGHDRRDSTSLDVPVSDYREYLGKNLRGMRAGIPKEYFELRVSDEVKSLVEKAIDVFADCGVEIVDVSLPLTKYALACYYLIATAEASSNLARYDGVRYGYRSEEAPDTLTMFQKTRDEGFGAEAKRRILLGTYALSTGYYDQYYLKALKVRTLLKESFIKAFEDCDFMIAPTTPRTAFRIGERIDDPVEMYAADTYTVTANLAGVPALSIPCGFGSQGLPVGLQLMGPHLGEGQLLQAAYAFEQQAGVAEKRPALEVS